MVYVVLYPPLYMQTLKQLRESKGIKPEKAAVAVKKSSVTIHDWESGRTPPSRMSFESAVALCELYDITLDQFADIVMPPNQP